MATRVSTAGVVNTVTVSGGPLEPLFQGIIPAVKTLYVCGGKLEELLDRPRLAIVGSRKLTPYGRQVTETFAGQLARQGVVIVSGLSYGVDAVAHQAALDAGGLTVAVLPSSLTRLYPAAHTNLARRIVEHGGLLLSEYPPEALVAYKNQFIERNRIVSGMSDALLITEAAAGSGTMHTARFALEQGKDVLAVPGNITSPTSEGTNNLIKAGAAAATTPEDVMRVLGVQPQATPARKVQGGTPQEQLILDLLAEGLGDGNQLLERSELPIEHFNHALTMLELTGKVRALGGNQWTSLYR